MQNPAGVRWNERWIIHLSGERAVLRNTLSQSWLARRCYSVNSTSEAVVEGKADDAPFDFEAVFRDQYERIARVIARVVRDPARAEELAVEVFLKLWRNRRAQGERAEGWLYRSAVRMGLDELRRRTRRARYESFLRFGRATPTPEEVYDSNEEQERVRSVLAAIGRRPAELLLLRSQELSYDEVASVVGINPASVGTLLSRAQDTFRKEYLKRYGKQHRNE
jgi:RNA polymerase sigma-70 factor, ECF subfamily